MKKIAIIGAGPAGIEAASILAKNGNEVQLFEKSSNTLSNILDKAYLFPDFSSAQELADKLNAKLLNDKIQLTCNTEIVDVKKKGEEFKLVDKDGKTYIADSVLITTGYTLFDAHRKEELGYGIYKGVITSLDLERMIRHQQISTFIGELPKRVVFLQCVGSRDEKSGNHYCSKVCCVTAVKQAIEVRKMLPDAEIYIYYMDLRMWGQGFEEMYRTAQEKYDIRFVRGRISEASATFDGRVQIKSEDTLIGQPLKMTTDLLVLMAGMEPSKGTRTLAEKCGIAGDYRFIATQGPHTNDNLTAVEGIFVAGSAKRPMSVRDTLTDAAAAALAMM
ncbi:MAG: CoB--CoM heterodisulfide reductase iron-sulfur subunit A family protein [Bacteroidales bacterium]|nr:CoB--CoM heterodisulfide reductase iron-sulfur subunit A family protein [Bacteroidales bacterium]